MSSEVPSPESTVWLRMPGGGDEHRTVVVSTLGSSLIVRAPGAFGSSCLPDDASPEGQEIGVVWVHRDQPLQIRARFMAVLEDPPGTWHLECVGQAEPTQRRQYVRANVTIPVHLRIDGDTDPVKGMLSNLSEGGARAVVPVKWVRNPAEEFTVSMPEVGEGLEVRAHVRWVAKDDPDLYKIGMSFLDVPGAVCDQIRSYVFAQQLAERRRMSGM